MIIAILKRGRLASDCGPTVSPLPSCVRGNVETGDVFCFRASGKVFLMGSPRVRRKAETELRAKEIIETRVMKPMLANFLHGADSKHVWLCRL